MCKDPKAPRLLKYRIQFLVWPLFLVPFQPLLGQTTWRVTITIDSNWNANYDVKPDPSTSKCPPGGTTLAQGDIPVCKGDTIKWRVHFKKNGLKAHVVVSQADFILDGGNGLGAPTLSTDQDADTPGGGVLNNAQVGRSYNYCVTVRDKSSGHEYLNDPKIIVGGSNQDTEAELRKVEAELKRIASGIKDNPDLKKQLEQLAKQVQDLVKAPASHN